MKAEEGAKLLEAAKAPDFAAFARFLTWLERASLEQALSLEALLQPGPSAFRLGITGPPGAGKSTLLGRMITQLRVEGLKVGVMAVDPSSPFSRGAILGDRIRYSEHFLDPGVFIRSLGTRGSFGGLSRSAFLMARAFDCCGFDILLIETVGVGQTELDILHVADQVCVVLVPESGDSIQAMKAGLMEIADLFVVNKADRPGAEALQREIQAAIADNESEKAPEVFKCVASEGRGVAELAKHILDIKQTITKMRNSPTRLREEAKALLRRQWEIEIDQRLHALHSLSDFKKFCVSK